jgi:uncharacterized glyoxalase superfamily protein PhnB
LGGETYRQIADSLGVHWSIVTNEYQRVVGVIRAVLSELGIYSQESIPGHATLQPAGEVGRFSEERVWDHKYLREDDDYVSDWSTFGRGHVPQD